MLLPKKVGSFTLMRSLGADGLTESYVGILDDPAGKQMVARRVLPHVARDPQRLGELRVRVKDLQACRHPALVPLLDFVEVDGEHYILEDWIDAVSLRDLLEHHIERGVGLMHNVYLNLATQICNGLEALHGRPGTESGAANVLHMGLTPEAIHLTRDGRVLVGSYGLVRSPTALSHTGTNSIGLGMEYLAPEQTHQEQPLSPASDIFALGTVLYELLTMKPMFRADSPLQTIHRIRRAEVTTQLLEVKELLPGLDKVLYRALSLNPRHRYQRAFVLREDLRGLMAGYTFSDIETVVRDELAPVFQARAAGHTDELPRIGTSEGPTENTAALLGGVEPSVFDSEHDTERDRGPEARWVDPMLPEHSDPDADAATAEDDLHPVDLPGDLGTEDGPPRDETSWMVRQQQGDVDETVDSAPVPDAAPPPRDRPAPDPHSEDLDAPQPSPLGAQSVPEEVWSDDAPAHDNTAAMLRGTRPDATEESAAPPQASEAPVESHASPPSEQDTWQAEEPPPGADDATWEEPAPPPAPVADAILPDPAPNRAGPTLAPPAQRREGQGPAPAGGLEVPATPAPAPRVRPSEPESGGGGPNWLLLGGAGGAMALVVLSLACLGVGGLGMLTRTGSTSIPPQVATSDGVVSPPGAAAMTAEGGDDPQPTMGTTQPEPDPEPVRPDPEPVRPDPAPVRPDPVPVRPDPEPVRPDPEPVRPDPEPVRPDPAPVRPDPVPVRPEPIPAPPPPPPQETFDAVAMVEEPAPVSTPSGPLTAEDLSGASDAAFAGTLDAGLAARLLEVPADDPQYTRARTLLFLDAKARGDGTRRDEHLSALMALPENRYNPALLVEEAQIAMGREDWRTALERAQLAERHWARLPSELIFSRKAMMYEIQALAHTGLFYDSDGDDIDALNGAISGWERYRRHVERKSKSDMIARADEHLDRLYEIQRRVE